MYLLMIHVRILKKQTTICSKYALTAHTTVPTDVRTHPRHVLLAIAHTSKQNCCTYCTYLLLYVQLMDVFIYCCTYFLCPMQVASTYGTDNTLRKKIRDLRLQILAGDDEVIDTVTTPKRGQNRVKTIAQ